MGRRMHEKRGQVRVQGISLIRPKIQPYVLTPITCPFLEDRYCPLIDLRLSVCDGRISRYHGPQDSLMQNVIGTSGSYYGPRAFLSILTRRSSDESCVH